MGTIVRVWSMTQENGYIGHVSLDVGGTYMSFWPSDAGGKKDVKVNVTHAPRHPSSVRVDERLEGGRCDKEIYLDGLNEQAMRDAWEAFVTSQAGYNIVRNNCSTAAAAILEVGSGITPSFAPQVPIDNYVHDLGSRLALRIRFFGSMINMWSPDAVARYAEQIRTQKT
jgi:hypothetical protein